MAGVRERLGDLQGVPFSQGYLNAGGVRPLPAGDRDKPAGPAAGPADTREAYVTTSSPMRSTLHLVDGHVGARLHTDKPGHRSRSGATSSAPEGVPGRDRRAARALSGESLGRLGGLPLRRRPSDRLTLVFQHPGGSRRSRGDEADHRLSMAAAENRAETVQPTGIKWLMADKSRDYDDIVASRQQITVSPVSSARCATSWPYRDPGYPATQPVGAHRLWRDQCTTLVLWTSDDRPPMSVRGRRIAQMIPGARFEGDGRLRTLAAVRGSQDVQPAAHTDFLLGR